MSGGEGLVTPTRLPAIQELANLATEPNWATEDAEAHLLPQTTNTHRQHGLIHYRNRRIEILTLSGGSLGDAQLSGPPSAKQPLRGEPPVWPPRSRRPSRLSSNQ
jgi:hypothetical protein